MSLSGRPTDAPIANETGGIPSTSPLDQYHPTNPNATTTNFPGDPVLDQFQTTGSGFDGDKSQDFAGATGGTDAFSATPNAKSIDEFEAEQDQGKGIFGKIKEKLSR